MKNVSKTLAASVLAVSMCIGLTGCFGASKKCKEAGLEFMDLALGKEVEDMADMCTDDDEALACFGPYAADNEAVDLLLERATVEYTSNSKKDGKITIVYTVTLPDYDAAIDEDPEDIDEFEDLLDEVEGTVEIEVSLVFTEKRDEWLIDNYDDFVEDFYDELYGIDFGFQSEYEGWVATENWWGADGTVYSGDRYYLDLDLNITNEHYNDQMVYTFKVFCGGNLIYTSSSITDSGFLENYCYNDDTSLGVEYFPAGSYTFVLYDSNGVEFYSSTCTVE